MKAIVLTKHGKPDAAFKMEERAVPVPGPGELIIKVEASGLNFADVLARNGLYRDAPAPPSILGYEVVGKVHAIGAGVSGYQTDDRVLAFTRFGGYASYAVTDSRAVVRIPDGICPAKAAALATQYCTAYYGAYELVNLFEGDHVLIHAAAGGVGTALVQLAKAKGCVVYGTAGSDAKMDYLKSIGVDYPINYTRQDFYGEIRKIRGKAGVDVVFDSIGGQVFRKSLKLLSAGGKIVAYGAAERMGGRWGKLSTIKLLWNYGYIVPAYLLMSSKSILGLNMLRIADHKPEVLQRCLKSLVRLYIDGIVEPQVGGAFKPYEISKAHSLLESRSSTGKIVILWEENGADNK